MLARLFFSFCVLFVWILKAGSENNEQRIHFKSIRCVVSEKYVYNNFSCYAKSLNRTTSTGTIIGTMKKPVNKVFLEFTLFYKYGVIYREVMHTPKFEWCSLMKDGNSNKMIAQLVSLVSDSAPQIIHECPYTELYVNRSVLKLNSMLSIFPSGDYKLSGNATNGRGELILTTSTVATMITPDKETFG